MKTEEVVEWLGGSDVLGLQIRSDVDLALAVERGFPTVAADLLIHRGNLTAEEFHAIVSGDRRQHRRLSSAESDRLVRIVRVLCLAEETFGAREKAHRWLRKRNRALRGHVPLYLLRLDAGGRLVEQALHRLAHGITT